MDTAWHRWRREIFGDPYLVWHDGPDFTAMLDAARTDAAAVAGLLRAGLAERDPLAASGLAELADAGLAPPDAADLLRTIAADATGELLIRAGQALFAVTGDPAWAEPIVSVLHRDESEYVRLDAAMALAPFPPSDALVAAVAQGVRDPAYLVRYHSANTLLRYAGKRGDLSDRPALFAKIAGDDPSGWHRASAELSET
jgi:HEAT repeat protein